jgi:D-alanine--poly(phosphoribitol) ligase subunit 1
MDVFMALTQGGTLVPLSKVERKFRPAVAIKNRRIAVWQSVPSVLEFIMQEDKMNAEHLGSLRVMSFCGDALRERQLDALFTARPDLVVYNTYGTTETMGFNTINQLTAENYQASCDAVGLAIGDEVPGWRVHLYGGDHADEGEIVVASDYLSLGYWGDEDQTRKAFRQVSFGNEPTQRAYFTGDWGVRKEGRLYCGGRMDRQVKIQGERIELGGVDELLREAGFADAYTLIIDGELVAFVESETNVDVAEVRDRLLRSLPVQAVPGKICAMSSLPRQNGKIDRQALEREASR